MKVETPQILWNSEGDKGINAALNSISMLESGLADNGEEHNAPTSRKYGHVMVTAGSTPIVNLWKLSFVSHPAGSGMLLKQQAPATKIEYLCCLTRHELSVNTVAFSPDGLHLATGGESGAVVVWSVPPSMRGNRNGRHFWSSLGSEKDLNVKIIHPSGQGICDISWSADSKRFIAGTIDHSVIVCEDTSYDANQRNSGEAAVESKWQVVFRNSMDHTQFVQGVAYDPLGVYLATMGSDRTVRLFPRKTPPKSKKKVLRPANTTTDCCPPLEHQQMVAQLLTESKLELSKSKLIKFRKSPEQQEQENNAPKPPRSHLYVDESTLESFFRRLSWTSDGAYLVTPAALWHPEDSSPSETSNEKSAPTFATYLFARHKFDEPCKVFSGLEKPSLVVRPSPVLYKLPGSCEASEVPDTDCKENESPLTRKRSLPYRSIFAVLTLDSVLIYDTHHTRPLSIIQGLHYASMSDCQWTADGMNLVVSSTDGYISIVSFDQKELGEVYAKQALPQNQTSTTGTAAPRTVSPSQPVVAASNKLTNNNVVNSAQKIVMETPLIPPCEPGQSATLEGPPSKRPKKTRITPTLISAPATTAKENTPTITTIHTKRPAEDLCLEKETNNVGEAVTKMTLNTEEKPKKKKKRIQPLLISPAGN